MINFEEFKAEFQKKKVEEYIPHSRPVPLVSVLVQAYNHSPYISECLDAILNQEIDFPYEIILGEDYSSDGTRELCLQYAKTYPDRIRLFLHHPSNKIRVKNTTTGNFNVVHNFFSAKGEFIAFCEGDDVWKDCSKLQKQVNFLKANPDYVLCYHSFQEVDQKGINLPDRLLLDQPSQDLTSTDLKKLEYHPLLSTVVFRRKFRELPEEILSVINMDTFLLSFLGSFGKGKFLDAIKSNWYRRHGGGIWSGSEKVAKLKSKELTFTVLGQFYKQEREWKMSQHFYRKRRSIVKSLFWLHLQKMKSKLPLTLFRR